MSRSTASPPLERSVVSEDHWRASEADEMSKNPWPASCVDLFSGGLPLLHSASRTYAAERRRETNPHSNPQEVHCDADAVRSVPRV